MKGVITLEEWDEIKEHIQYDYVADNYFSELKEKEIMNERMNLVGVMDPFVGKYFSVEYIRRQILRQTDSEMKEIDDNISAEMEAGIIQDPMELAQQEMMQGMPEEEEGIDPKDYEKGNI